ncbi:MAG TPA: V-type ATP synthase subunit D [Candidatus Omnitrophota bacterium]|nr:V-type ATP synthase subunit D [Candidatus Omnitrophota bacterium]HRZ14571.1 V-type ATP synthase subunit D [Candidatus Omnitrophota bacterium]
MKITIAATKTNLLKAKKSLSLTREGYELLDEKRRILMAELTAIIDSVDTLQGQVDTALRQGYEFVNKAVVSMGRQRVEEISYAVNIKTEIGISQRRVMGVSLPVIALRLIEHPPYYSPHEVNLYVDESIVKFRSILELIGQLAEKKIALLRMAREAQKTIRKVNALEKVYLPYYKDTVKYISDRLDEESRDSFSMLKLIKKAQANQ